MPARPALAVAAATLVLGVAGCGTSAPSSAPSSAPAPSATTSPAPRRTSAPAPFAGTTIAVDPGHNGGNAANPGVIGRQIWNGRQYEDCNTTGTATDAGYPESRFNFAVAGYLVKDLRRAGARVVLTRRDNHGVGPCVDQRARMVNRSHADVAIDIHADGGPPSGRGFAILQPVASGVNDDVVRASRRYAALLRSSFRQTGMPLSTYDGVDGLTTRTDLAGLNLTTVPQVLIECGNMRNARDAAMLTAPAFQRRAARAIMTAMAGFLRLRAE
jgi:N-acetylmuramoyl-L-alanine amidase